MRDWLRARLAEAGYVIFNTRSAHPYARDCLFTTNNDSFRSDPEFRIAYARGVQASHGVDPRNEWRLHIALWCAKSALRGSGHFVECGVNAGFTSSAIMQWLSWRCIDRIFYLIDTFAGPVSMQFSPEEVTRGRLAMALEAQRKGAYVTDLSRLRDNFREWPNAQIVQGVVPDVLSELEIDRVAFLHLDMNCAYPETAALQFFWPFISPGGIVLFDDYAYFGNESLKRAIDHVGTKIGVHVLSLPTGQGLIIR